MLFFYPSPSPFAVASFLHESSGVSTRLFRPASSSETVSGGNYRSREVHHDRLTTPYEDGVWDLQLKLKGGSNMGVDEDIAFVEVIEEQTIGKMLGKLSEFHKIVYDVCREGQPNKFTPMYHVQA